MSGAWDAASPNPYSFACPYAHLSGQVLVTLSASAVCGGLGATQRPTYLPSQSRHWFVA